ncbi:MAG: CopG family transcriptional regulator [Myxococcaceae bacterium]
MRKTTVYLEDEAVRALKRLARERGRPEAELIREALNDYVRSTGRPKPKSLGMARGGGGVARNVDRLLSKGFGHDGSRR